MNPHQEQEEKLRYMTTIPHEESLGRLILAMAGLAVVVPLLLTCVYKIATQTAAPDLVPPTFGLWVLFVWLVRRALKAYRERIPEENESIMNFAPLGVLTCICEQSDPIETVRAERRQTCRTCGHAIVERNPAKLDTSLSSREITNIQAKLRLAAVKSKHMELPATIENVDELIEYLKSAPPEPPNDPPKPSRARQFA